jgi:hypothetical protein
LFRRAVLAVMLVALLWAAASAVLYALMRQPPETFGSVMSHVPGMAMMVLPFRPLWMSARAGHLRPGDSAPDFALSGLHKERVVRLSDEYRHQPVVLVFGSYT